MDHLIKTLESVPHRNGMNPKINSIIHSKATKIPSQSVISEINTSFIHNPKTLPLTLERLLTQFKKLLK